MTQQVIDSARLKSIRKGRKISRPKLAKLSGLSERQLSKLETGSAVSAALEITVIERLADALQVTPLALTGDLPLIKEDLEPVASAPSSCGCC